MKKIILSLLILTLLPLTGCHDPEELVPSVANRGINNATVYTSWDEYHTAGKGIPCKIDYDTRTITVQVPYTWPIESDNVQSLEDYKKVYIAFNLDNNVYIEPALHTIDLTQTYEVTVTDQQGVKSPWTIKAALTKHNGCDIESFTIRGMDLSAMIDKDNARASLIYFEELKNVFADYTLSPHARIVPDPAKQAFWCSPDKPMKFTVIAADGVTSKEWTLMESQPQKIDQGMAKGSGKLLWAEKLSKLGVTSLDKAYGLGVTDEYCVVNVQDADPILINAKDGKPAGTLNLGSWKGDGKNFYLTSDDAGHILVNNFANGSDSAPKTISIARMESVTSTPEPFIEWEVKGAYGKMISVTGDVYGDALISVVYCGWSATGSTSILTWTVKNGVVENQKPHWRQAKGMKGWTNGDASYINPELTSDYFAAGYSPNRLTWVNGTSDQARTDILGELTNNEQMLALDVETFNGVPYVITSMETSFTWGVSGAMWVCEAKYPETFNGTLKTGINEQLPAAVVYQLDRGADGFGKYGGRLNDGTNVNAYTDVKLHASPDGYFMYAYFMFCNGYVGCVQFDCLAK